MADYQFWQGEYIQGSSNKFFVSIALTEGNDGLHISQWGRRGTVGQFKLGFANPTTARGMHNRKVSEKTAKGYSHGTRTGGSVAATIQQLRALDAKDSSDRQEIVDLIARVKGASDSQPVGPTPEKVRDADNLLSLIAGSRNLDDEQLLLGRNTWRTTIHERHDQLEELDAYLETLEEIVKARLKA